MATTSKAATDRLQPQLADRMAEQTARRPGDALRLVLVEHGQVTPVPLASARAADAVAPGAVESGQVTVVGQDTTAPGKPGKPVLQSAKWF